MMAHWIQSLLRTENQDQSLDEFDIYVLLHDLIDSGLFPEVSWVSSSWR